jgi:hypothetical protein
MEAWKSACYLPLGNLAIFIENGIGNYTKGLMRAAPLPRMYFNFKGIEHEHAEHQ